MSKKVVVVGSGFGGMWAALSAARCLDLAKGPKDSVEISVISPEVELKVRPRFYERDPESMTAPLGPLYETAGIRHVAGEATAIDTEARTVTVEIDGRRITERYDGLVLAPGSVLSKPDIPGIHDHAFTVDQIADAGRLERHILALAGRPDTPARERAVVVGGGFTGLEMAAELPDRLREALGPGTVPEVILIEREDAIGPDLGAGPRDVIIEALTQIGVAWRLRTTVASLDETGLTTSAGDRIEAATVIWTGGVRAAPIVGQVAGERDPLGRLHVRDDLSVPGHDHVFATGDAAHAATDDVGNHALMSCQHAMALGRSAGHNVMASLLGRPTLPYRQVKYVTCLDLGSWGAVYTEGWDRQVVMQGAEAKALKRQINGEWIYPPTGSRAEIFVAADPARLVVA